MQNLEFTGMANNTLTVLKKMREERSRQDLRQMITVGAGADGFNRKNDYQTQMSSRSPNAAKYYGPNGKGVSGRITTTEAS